MLNLEQNKGIKTKEELNLAEYPLQYLNYKISPDTKTVEWHGEVITKDGILRQASWILTGSDKYGLPRFNDKDVLLALLYFWKLQGFQSEILKIDSILDVLKILHWNTSTKSYKKLEESLRRLVGASIMATYSFWDNKLKDYLPSIAFHILEYYKFERMGHRISLIVKASEQLWESIKSNYIKTLDLEFYLSLETPLLKALYSYLDKKAYQNEEFTIDIMKLAEHLGMSLSRGLKRIKYDIKEASNVLVVKGFLHSYSINNNKITFYFNKEYLSREEQERVEAVEDRIKYLVEIMEREIEKGRKKTYYRIARYYPEDFILRAVDEVKKKLKDSEASVSRYKLFKELLKSYIKTEIRDKLAKL